MRTKQQQRTADASRILVGYLRAFDAVTRPGMRSYLLEQCPGLCEDNVQVALDRALHALKTIGVVWREEDPSDGEMTFHFDHQAWQRLVGAA